MLRGRGSVVVTISRTSASTYSSLCFLGGRRPWKGCVSAAKPGLPLCSRAYRCNSFAVTTHWRPSSSALSTPRLTCFCSVSWLTPIRSLACCNVSTSSSPIRIRDIVTDSR